MFRAEAITLANLSIILLTNSHYFAFYTHIFTYSQNYAGFNMHCHCGILPAHFKYAPKQFLLINTQEINDCELYLLKFELIHYILGLHQHKESNIGH